MRFTGQIHSGKNVREIILRGLQSYVPVFSVQSAITYAPANGGLERPASQKDPCIYGRVVK